MYLPTTLLATALLALSTSAFAMPDNCKRDAALGIAPRGNCIGGQAHEENPHAGTQQPPSYPALAAQHQRHNTGADSNIARPYSTGVESDASQHGPGVNPVPSYSQNPRQGERKIARRSELVTRAEFDDLVNWLHTRDAEAEAEAEAHYGLEESFLY
ncbi:hypothetical protein MMC11_007178 [Xylographa trunciseda]|nr:hypothetical protein [Xylographa trunciseda]